MAGPLELIVTACLVSAPDNCAEHRLRQSLEGGDPGQCMYSSPPQIALWQTMNPKWTVKSWRCALISDDELA
jgi:hypothetical protein